MARWIAFEGGEGSGKSTQAALLADRLGAVLTREPGGTAFGARLRAALLDSEGEVDPRAEALLVAADRAQHVAEIVRPALDAGQTVVSDRSVWSSLAYQGGGRGLARDVLRQVNDWATQGAWPDLVVLLDVDGATSRARTGGPRDRMEAAGGEFHLRVAAEFRALARQHGWVVVSGEGSVDEVAGRVWRAVGER